VDDQHYKELVEARNNADAAIYQAQKAYQQNGAVLPEAVNAKIGELQQAAQGDDRERIQRLTAELQQLTASSAQENKQAGHDDNNGEDVVEGEFHDA
jgi:molecular chaperone DnaK